MVKQVIAKSIAGAAEKAAKFVGCEAASTFYMNQPKEPKAISELKKAKVHKK